MLSESILLMFQQESKTLGEKIRAHMLAVPQWQRGNHECSVCIELIQKRQKVLQDWIDYRKGDLKLGGAEAASLFTGQGLVPDPNRLPAGDKKDLPKDGAGGNAGESVPSASTGSVEDHLGGWSDSDGQREGGDGGKDSGREPVRIQPDDRADAKAGPESAKES